MRASLLLLLALAGCLQSSAEICDDGRICPAGAQCYGGGCVLDEQLTACDDRDDGDACAYSGVDDGRCVDGVCLFGCGDGVVVGAEDCDGAALGGFDDCTDLGYHEALPLRCTPTCEYDLDQCGSICGDGTLDPGEDCEPGVPGALDDCTELGFYVAGPLGCNGACRYDVGACEGFCGNGAVDGPEECDASLIDLTDCTQLGYHDAGPVTCDTSCRYDDTACGAICGDGTRNGPEVCDDLDLGPVTCEDLGYYDEAGLACNAACGFDDAGCTGFCGDHERNGPETCDEIPRPGEYCTTFGYDVGVLRCSSFCSPGFASCLRVGWSLTTQLDDYVEDLWGTAADDLYAAGSNLHHWDGAAWTEVAGVPDSTSWGGTWGTAADDVFAVGSAGAVWHFDGTTWTSMATPTSAYLNAVWGTAADDVYAVSDTQVLHFDGAAWTVVVTGGSQLRGIGGTGPDDVWAVGAGEYRVWNGAAWTTYPSSASFQDVWAAAPGDVFLAASDGIYHWDGDALVRQAFANDVFSVWGFGPDDVYAVGNVGYLAHYDGVAWSRRNDPTNEEILYALWGESPGALVIGDDAGHIFGYAGIQTLIEPTPTTADLHDVWATSTGAIAVGTGGTILAWDGQAWSTMTSPTTQTLYAVWGSSDTDVFAVGGHNVILHYDGDTWTKQAEDVVSVSKLTDVWGTGPDDVWAVGSNIRHYDGDTWSVSLASSYEAVAGSGPDDVYVTSTGFVPASRHWNGTSWGFTSLYPGTHLQVLSPTQIFTMIDSDSPVTARFDGASTTTVFTPGFVEGIDAVRFAGFDVRGPGDVLMVGERGWAVHFDGTAWNPIRTNVSQDLHAVTRIAGGWMAVGAGGVSVLIARDVAPIACAGVGTEPSCTDGRDDDCDFLVDDDDPDCAAPGVCFGARDLTCGESYTGTTADGARYLLHHGCSQLVYAGAERSFRVTPPATGPMTITLSGMTGDLNLFVAGRSAGGGCDPAGACLGSSETASTADEAVTLTSADPVYAIVDTPVDYVVSPFTIAVSCP